MKMKNIILLLVITIFSVSCSSIKNENIKKKENKLSEKPYNNKIINKYDGIIVDMTDNKVMVKNKHDGSITEYGTFKKIIPTLRTGKNISKGLVLGCGSISEKQNDK